MASEADGEEAQKLSWHNFERDMAGLPSALFTALAAGAACGSTRKEGREAARFTS